MREPIREILKKRLPLFIVLILFIAAKIPYLHYAYYWDECWPYAAAIKDMYHHGVSLMPNAVDPELSRGHPLFFHASAAMWMHIFGSSHVSMHSFALLIAVLLLVALFEAGLRMYNGRVALLAILLVAVQEVFFIQSSMVLCEVLVAFLCFLSLVFYVKERYLLVALCLTLLFFTKESGLIMGFILGIDSLVIKDKNIAFKRRLYRILSIGVPCILIAAFFLIQKHIRGWYIFPYHAELVRHEWNDLWVCFRLNSVNGVFYQQYRFYYFLLLIVIATIAAIKQKSGKLMSILLPGICIYYFVDDMRAGRLLPSVPFFIAFVLSVFYFLYTYSGKRYHEHLYQRKMIRLGGLFVLCFMAFSATYFFTPRYLLAAMIPLFFVTAVSFDMLISRAYSWLYYVVIVAVITIATIAYIQNDNYGDCDHGAYNGLEVQQGVVDYFEQHVAHDQIISTGSFLTTQHLSNPATGFVNADKAFKKMQWGVDGNTQYVIFDNIGGIDYRYTDFKKDTNFYLAQKIEMGKVWAEIYKRK